MIDSNQKTSKRTVKEMREFAKSKHLTIPKGYKKPQIIDFLKNNLSSEIVIPFLFSSSADDFSRRLNALEGQVQELIDQFKDFRTIVLKNINPETELTIQQVLLTAKKLSNNNLTSLDKLRKQLNPLALNNIDWKLKEYLIQLMEDREIQLQEMKSKFKVQIRTDIFGGFKA